MLKKKDAIWPSDTWGWEESAQTDPANQTRLVELKATNVLNCANFIARQSTRKLTKKSFSSPSRDPSFNSRAGKAISENEIVASLPAEAEQRSGRLYDMALDTFNNFLSSHSLQVKFPTETTKEVSRAIDEGEISFWL